MPLAFMFRHLLKYKGDVLFARSSVNTIAIVNSIVFIRDVGRKKAHSTALRYVIPLLFR